MDVLDVLIHPVLPSTMYAATHNDGVFKSTDSGATWSTANSGLAETDVRNLLLSRFGETLYAAPRSRVFRSTDGGATWVKSGLEGSFPELLAADPNDPWRIYAGSRESSDGFITRINSAGQMIFSSYFGGSGTDHLTGVGLAADGIIVAGPSDSSDFPTETILTGSQKLTSLTDLSPGDTPDKSKTVKLSSGYEPQVDLTFDPFTFRLPEAVEPGNTYPVLFGVRNKASADIDASSVKLIINRYGPRLYPFVRIVELVPDRGTCVNLQCDLGTIAPGVTVNVNAKLINDDIDTPDEPETFTVTGRVSSPHKDKTDDNFKAEDSVAVPYTPPPRGDANGDGQITVADVFHQINGKFGDGPPPSGCAPQKLNFVPSQSTCISGDANGDGVFSVADIFYLINYLFAGGPAPPP